MKVLLVSLLLFAFTQTAQAASVDLNEGQSKKLYNILATYGLRYDYPGDYETHEWLKPVKCKKSVEDGVYYICEGYDKLHNVIVARTGTPAKKLYDMLVQYNGKVCNVNDGTCNSSSPDIYCIYYWLHKDNPSLVSHRCRIEHFPAPIEEKK